MGKECTQYRFLSEPATVRRSAEVAICDRCLREGYTPEDAQVVERFAELFYAARVLFEADITEETRIIPTLVFAEQTAASDPATLDSSDAIPRPLARAAQASEMSSKDDIRNRFAEIAGESKGWVRVLHKVRAGGWHTATSKRQRRCADIRVEAYISTRNQVF